MADLWQAAVAGGDAAKLSELVLSAADFKPESALSVLKTCVALLEKKMSLPISEGELWQQIQQHNSALLLCRQTPTSASFKIQVFALVPALRNMGSIRSCHRTTHNTRLEMRCFVLDVGSFQIKKTEKLKKNLSSAGVSPAHKQRQCERYIQ